MVTTHSHTFIAQATINISLASFIWAWGYNFWKMLRSHRDFFLNFYFGKIGGKAISIYCSGFWYTWGCFQAHADVLFSLNWPLAHWNHTSKMIRDSYCSSYFFTDNVPYPYESDRMLIVSYASKMILIALNNLQMSSFLPPPLGWRLLLWSYSWVFSSLLLHFINSEVSSTLNVKVMNA